MRSSNCLSLLLLCRTWPATDDHRWPDGTIAYGADAGRSTEFWRVRRWIADVLPHQRSVFVVEMLGVDQCDISPSLLPSVVCLTRSLATLYHQLLLLIFLRTHEFIATHPHAHIYVCAPPSRLETPSCVALRFLYNWRYYHHYHNNYNYYCHWRQSNRRSTARKWLFATTTHVSICFCWRIYIINGMHWCNQWVPSRL